MADRKGEQEQSYTTGGNNGRAPRELPEKSPQIHHGQLQRQTQIQRPCAGNAVFSDGDSSSQDLRADSTVSEGNVTQVITRAKPDSRNPIRDEDESKEQDSDTEDNMIGGWKRQYLGRGGNAQLNSPYSHNSPYLLSSTHLPFSTESPAFQGTQDIAITSRTPSRAGTVPSSTEWEILDNTSTSSTGLSRSSTFPGTWPNALCETTSALSSVSRASATYAAAISKSGLGRASLSIGSALLSSTNRGALTAASWAVNRTGVTMNELPRPVRGWLERGQRKRRGSSGRRVIVQRINERMEDERGAFVLETTELANRGGIAEGEMWGDEAEEDVMLEDSDDELLKI